MSWRIAVQTLPGPSLDLLFTNRSLVDNISGQNLITFTRASSATYVDSNRLIKTAATNEPRFDHNPVTGESLGLLIEEQRTNLLLYSEQLDNASWTPTNVTVATNATTSPGGDATAESFLETTANGIHGIIQSVTTTSTRHTFTFFIKANGRTRFIIGGSSSLGGSIGAGIFFDLSTNSYVSGAASGAIASVQVLSNDWKRISYTWDANAATGNLGIYLVDSGTNYSYVGDVSKGIFLWGAQLEAGAFPTSYIPTTTAAVTRAADVASITGANFSSWYNQTQGTLFTALRPTNTSQGGVIGLINSSGANISEGFYMAASTAQLRATNYFASNSASNDFVNNSPTLGLNRIALAGLATDSGTGAYFNGLTGSVNSSQTQGFVNIAGIKIGESYGQRLTGTIARLTYWPARLPNPILQTLTQ